MAGTSLLMFWLTWSLLSFLFLKHAQLTLFPGFLNLLFTQTGIWFLQSLITILCWFLILPAQIPQLPCPSSSCWESPSPATYPPSTGQSNAHTCILIHQSFLKMILFFYSWADSPPKCRLVSPSLFLAMSVTVPGTLWIPNTAS